MVGLRVSMMKNVREENKMAQKEYPGKIKIWQIALFILIVLILAGLSFYLIGSLKQQSYDASCKDLGYPYYSEGKCYDDAGNYIYVIERMGFFKPILKKVNLDYDK